MDTNDISFHINQTASGDKIISAIGCDGEALFYVKTDDDQVEIFNDNVFWTTDQLHEVVRIYNAALQYGQLIGRKDGQTELREAIQVLRKILE